jgi:hypothetical protein
MRIIRFIMIYQMRINIIFGSFVNISYYENPVRNSGNCRLASGNMYDKKVN